MIYLTRRERFSSAHRMFRPGLSDEENMRIYGKCSNPLWHGHNYVLKVTVRGEPDTETGFFMNATRLKEIMTVKVVAKLDHKNMNLETDFMAGKVATTENLAMAIWNELAAPLTEEGATLHCVRVEETENNYVEYYG
ncbi:MAG TPA: 6-pyruvoyl tetrahydrobiopterin synthase [Bacteroidales bacterium]|jgi:6-pyruvoyltetrahydropterin/6-carboxytetrahydropterin synthase|nr:6-pyruvoyl tetrahydrobiopterin synthase [Bacteroidales bacterium]